MLDTVYDTAVNQIAEVSLGKIEHPVHAEEAAPAMARMFLRRRIRASREHERAGSQRKSKRPGGEAETQHGGDDEDEQQRVGRFRL